MAPKNCWRLQDMLEFGVNLTRPSPSVIREDRRTADWKNSALPVEYGKAEMLYEESEIALLPSEAW